MFRQSYRYILSEAESALDRISEYEVDMAIDMILKGKQIFVYGSGRSGLVGKFFAMRLVQLGLVSYFVGETITPIVKKGDCVVLISNTGLTKSTLLAATVVKNMGVNIIAITSNPKSPLAHRADVVISLNPNNSNTNLAPLGTLFEISSVILLDSFISEIMKRTGQKEEDLRGRHAIWV